MKKNARIKRGFRTKIMINEVHKCKKEKEKKNAITSSSIISDNSKNDEVNTTILKNMVKKVKKKKKKYKLSTGSGNKFTYSTNNKLMRDTPAQSNIISPKKKLYTETSDKSDKSLNKNKTTASNSKKDKWSPLNPVLKASKDDKEFTLLKRKRRGGKKKIQKNKNSKSDKPKFNTQKHCNIQTNEENTFGLNKRKKNPWRKLVDTSTNTVISLVNDKLNSSILRPEVKIVKKKMDKKPKIHSINILENNNVVCTEKCQIKECLEFLLNCHDHKKKTYKDKKSKQKKKKKRNSKMVVQEKTEVSNEVIKHKHSKINEYSEKNAFKSHSKEIYYDEHNPNCGMQTPRGNEKNPLLLKKLFKKKKKKKKKKKAFKNVTQKEIIPPKKNTIEQQQSFTTSEKKFPDNDITTDCKNYDRDIFKKYFEFLSAHTANDKDAAMITPYSTSKTLIASVDDPFFSNKLLKKEKKRKAFKEATRVEIAPPKNDAMERKRLITECNEYSENEIAREPLHTSEMGDISMTHHINDYERVVVEKSFEFFSVRDEQKTKDQTLGNDEGTSYMISNTDIKSSNVLSSCAQESTRTGKSSIECDICSKTFISKYKLSIHYRTHTGEKPYTCGLCSRCFSNRSNLISHYRTHTGEKPYKCDVCSRCFSHRSSLVQHYRTHTGEKPYECDICSRCFTQRSVLISHYRTHTGEKPYGCDICSRCFTQRSSLIKHYRTHTGEKPYECDICSRCFSRQSNLIKHYRTHTGEKPYECDICSRCFTQRSTLVSHYRTHTGEKPYKCDVCSRCFSYQSSVINHYKTHTGEKPYECDICSRCFAQRSTLVSHYRTHTGEKPYKCDVCSRCFSHKSSLIEHYGTHTGEKPYKCDFSFAEKSFLSCTDH